MLGSWIRGRDNNLSSIQLKRFQFKLLNDKLAKKNTTGSGLYAPSKESTRRSFPCLRLHPINEASDENNERNRFPLTTNSLINLSRLTRNTFMYMNLPTYPGCC